MASSEVTSPLALENQSEVGTTTTTLKWNKVYLILCVVALLVDPLFLYIPVINQDMKCIGLDQNLKIVTLLLRSAVDLSYIVHIISQILGARSEDPQRRRRVKLVDHALEMAKRISWRYWLIDILAILPIPQVVILIFLTRSTRGSKSLNARKFLNSLVIFQYVPRALRMYRSYKEANKPPDNWNRFTLCLKVYTFIFASHVSGAIWYYFSIQREMDCWQYACRSVYKCEAINFGCGGNHMFKIVTVLNILCPINIPNSTVFDFGIFLDALQSGITGSTDFPQKFLHCFWWGLRSLSSIGQNLQTSSYAWENVFALCISITGMLLFLVYLNAILQELRTHHLMSQSLSPRWETPPPSTPLPRPPLESALQLSPPPESPRAPLLLPRPGSDLEPLLESALQLSPPPESPRAPLLLPRPGSALRSSPPPSPPPPPESAQAPLPRTGGAFAIWELYESMPSTSSPPSPYPVLGQWKRFESMGRPEDVFMKRRRWRE